MMSRDIFSCPIPTFLKTKLVQNKFVLVKDFQGLTVDALSSETGLSKSEAANVLSSLNFSPCELVSAADYFKKTETDSYITTFSTCLDELLGGGIGLSRTTEIYGLPGCGKTQLCMQLSVNVQLPESKRGVGGKALYVDTEGSFCPERLSEIAQGMLKRGSNSGTPSDEFGGLDSNNDNVDIDTILEGIHYYRCLNFEGLLAMINMLEDFIVAHPKVKLIVIDNIPYHLRYGTVMDHRSRSSILQNLQQTLVRLAQRNSLAVVWTNQMTTRFGATGESTFVPSLGDSWSHACCTRLLLRQESQTRSATILKSSYLPAHTARFQIKSTGICDDKSETVPDPHHLHTENQQGDDQDSAKETYDTPTAAAKRRRLDEVPA